MYLSVRPWWLRGCKCVSHRTHTGFFALPGGIERVSKIVICLGTKLCYCLQKTADFLDYVVGMHLNAVFVFKLITCLMFNVFTSLLTILIYRALQLIT